MGIYGPEGSLTGLLNATDNSNEPRQSINEAGTIIGLCATFMTIAWLCVGFRMYTRYNIVKSPGLDDLFVIFSLVTMSANLIVICLSTKSGLGEHIFSLGLLSDPPDVSVVTEFFKKSYVFNGTYCMATAFIKISLLLQYMRLYRRGTWLFTICQYTLGFTALWGLAYSIIAWFPCSNISDYWYIATDGSTNDVKCWGYGSQKIVDFKATYESHAAINVALDLLVMALPIPLYFDSDAHKKTKWGLVGIIVMGTVVNIFSLWRLAVTIQNQVTTYPTFDPTWYSPTPMVMAGLEIASACICASVPVFWGPMLSSASQLLGSIFVTHEVKVTSEHRFQGLGSRDAFGDRDLEMQTASLSRQGSEANLHNAAGSPRRKTRVEEWADKGGRNLKYQETWLQK
ncbi:hypothetical protein QBC35DRAFT_29812 [Podospora australis]|uniref:Rhodopsin domain-containing protein n=1 Tax=Podospora australis TaxID=1536484 RepID=A0AAN6WPN7_9PEZI|nr:hypothetical protein QBC35DRAFT_29812 [Podospora australis]